MILLAISETEALSYAAHASELASLTADPKQVAIFEDQTDHGLNLLLGETSINQEALDVLLDGWTNTSTDDRNVRSHGRRYHSRTQRRAIDW